MIAARTTRARLYRGARVIGDVQAALDGRYPARVARKVVYRRAAGWLQRALRLVGL